MISNKKKMGNDLSKPNKLSISKLPETPVEIRNQPIYRFNFNKPWSPKFWSEFYLTLFHRFDNYDQESTKNNIIHTPDQLFNLFYGCFEYIPDPFDILDNLIQSTIKKDKKIDKLSLLYEFHKDYGQYRYDSFIVTKSFILQGFFNQKLHDYMNKPMICTFHDISRTISIMSKMFVKEKISKDEFQKAKSVYSIIKDIIPPNQINPPKDFYYTKRNGQKFEFNGSSILPHCMTSNGYFLFILTNDSILHIFLLYMNGSIIRRLIQRKMDFGIDINNSFSIAASKEKLIIFCSKFKRIYRIADILANYDNIMNSFHNTSEKRSSQPFLHLSQNESAAGPPTKNKLITSEFFFSKNDYGVESNYFSTPGYNLSISPSFKEDQGTVLNDKYIKYTQIDRDKGDELEYVISDGISLAIISSFSSIKIFDYQSRDVLYPNSLKTRTLDFHKPIATTPMMTNGTYIGFISRPDTKFNILTVFSLVTGELVAEEQFASSKTISAISIDSINHCIFCVITNQSSINDENYHTLHFKIKRYNFLGSFNPLIFGFSLKTYTKSKEIKKKNAFKILASSFNLLACQLIGTQNVPCGLFADTPQDLNPLINSLNFFALEVSKEQKEKKFYIEALQSISVLIDLNLRYFEVSMMDLDDAYMGRLISIISYLPTNIGAFLFFLHLDSFLKYTQTGALTLLKTFFEKPQPPNLILFCLLQLEKTQSLYKIPFGDENPINSLIPQNLDSTSSLPHPILTMLYVHQHVLISSTNSFLKQCPYSDYEYTKKDSLTPLDFFWDYSQILINKFISAISGECTPQLIEESFIFHLFDNFLRAASILADSHRISQSITAMLILIMPKFVNLLENPKSSKKFKKSLKFLIYMFSKFSATLVKGGGESEFEQKFYWLIKQNINFEINSRKKSKSLNKKDRQSRNFSLLDSYQHLSSTEIDYFNDPRIAPFINDKNSSTMNQIYKKYKPQFNRNLNDDLKKLDRITLIGLCKHMKIIDQIIHFNFNKITSELKSALDQMIRIRSIYHKLIQQNKDYLNLFTLALILCRLNSDCRDAKKLASFITSEFPASFVADIIKIQTSRIEITLVGFSLITTQIETKFSILNSSISYCLSEIKDYDGLGSLFLCTDLSESQITIIRQFFTSILHLYKNVMDSRLILIIFRFFRDLEMFPSLQEDVFHEAVNILNEINQSQKKNAIEDSPVDYSLFALIYMLIRNLKFHFLPKMNTQSNLLLLSASLRTNYCSNDLFIKLTKKLWKNKLLSRCPRSICRVIFNALKSSNLDTNLVLKFFEDSFKIISDSLNNKSLRIVGSDIVWLFRRILNENLPVKELLINYMKKSEKLISTFSILGLQSNKLHPYSKVKLKFIPSKLSKPADISDNEKNTNFSKIYQYESLSYISIPKDDNHLVCFPLPFNIKNPSEVFKIQDLYGIPFIELNSDSFNDYDFILSFINKPFDNPSIEYLYYQVLAQFSRFPDFVKYLNQDIISILASKMEILAHYNADIGNIFNISSSLKEIETNNSLYQLTDKTFDVFLSPLIAKSTSFTVKFSEGYIGIVRDSLYPCNIRYELFHYPSGKCFPVQNSITIKAPIQIKIDYEKKKFKINDYECSFPGIENKLYYLVNKDLFRFVIAVKKNKKFELIGFDQSSSNEKSLLYYKDGSISQEKSQKLLLNFKELSPDKTPKVIPEINDILQLSYSINSLSDDNLFKSNFIKPPITLHPLNSNSASQDLISTLKARCINEMSGYFISMALMRISIFKPSLILNYSGKIFAYIILSLEKFNPNNFNNKNFFYDLNKPVWQENSGVFYGLGSEIFESLKSLIDLQDTKKDLSQYISTLVRSPSVHMGAIPNHKINFYPKTTNDKSVVGYSFLFIPEFKIHTNFPQFINSDNEVSLQPYLSRNNITELQIDTTSNIWTIGTVFEILILLKNFVYIADTAEYRNLIKSILIELYVSQSPAVRPFLNEFVEFIQSKLPTVPYDFTPKYISYLSILSSYISKHKVKENDLIEYQLYTTFNEFYNTEKEILNDIFSRNISCYFPEFFKEELAFCSFDKEATNGKINIPYVPIDSTSITETNLEKELSIMHHISKNYKSLIGFPFWEIFPYYFRLINLDDEKPIEPKIYQYSPKIKVLETHLLNELYVSIQLDDEDDGEKSKSSKSFPETVVAIYSASPEFEDPNYIKAQDFTKMFSIKAKKTYFTIEGYDGNWNIKIEKIKKKTVRIDNISGKTIQNIHQSFVNDMEMFAIKWTHNDTSILVNSIPMNELKDKKFSHISSLAENCTSLTAKYSDIVVKLRVLFVYHYNYIRNNFQNNIKTKKFKALKSWVSNEEASKAVVNSIACNNNYREIKINRFLANKLVTEGIGSSNNSIIGQLADQFKKYDNPELFRCKQTPWKVIFADERAVDAGGPMRELMTETSNSMFLPSSDLFVPLKEYYVPYSEGRLKVSEYRAVGQFIAIIIRCGFPQDLPFAPFVWKYIAENNITRDDILDSDVDFKTEMKAIILNNQPVLWETTKWNGKLITLPQHHQQSLANPEELKIYVNECIQFRMDSILPMLSEIRIGFVSNIGFESHPLLSGSLLSFLAQGSNIITLEQFKAISINIGFYLEEDEQYYERFWRSVDRLTNDQKHHLLQFITTLRRIPIQKSLNFVIKIDKLASDKPDMTLPTSSTCTNTLFWPSYSSDEIAYQKLLYSIMNCQTLDLV